MITKPQHLFLSLYTFPIPSKSKVINLERRMRSTGFFPRKWNPKICVHKPQIVHFFYKKILLTMTCNTIDLSTKAMVPFTDFLKEVISNRVHSQKQTSIWQHKTFQKKYLYTFFYYLQKLFHFGRVVTVKLLKC